MIPDRPMQFDVLNLSIDDSEWLLAWLETKTLTAQDLKRLRGVLSSCTAWSDEEIGQLTIRELIESIQAIQAGQSADPLAKTGGS